MEVVTPSYSEGVQKTPLKIASINCQSLCNKGDEIVDVVGEVGFVTETGLTGGISDEKFVGDLTPAGYSFHHVTRIHRKCGGVDVLVDRQRKVD